MAVVREADLHGISTRAVDDLVKALGAGGMPRRQVSRLSLASTNRVAPGGQLVLGARALPGNPFDGHTLADQIAQTERITGVPMERAYVNRGYRGHDADKARVCRRFGTAGPA